MSDPEDTGADAGAESGPDTRADTGEGATRCGYVAVVGAPNAGKSTLVNGLVGAKVAIVSPKVQTTRTRVLGITVEGASQLILVDTPGIFAPRRRLDRAMVAAAWDGAADADVVLLIVDAAARKVGADAWSIVDTLAASGRPALLALNKIDATPRDRLLDLSARLNERLAFARTFMISALSGDGVADLRSHLAGAVPAGAWLYPDDELSDMPMRLLAAELTREQIFRKLHQELPYAITVETEDWQAFEDGSVRIAQVVYVQRDSQKAIVLGKGGQMIKAIGSSARTEIAKALDQAVHLKLHVKVRPNWVDDPERYSPWGLDPNA
ncbi:MAG: GTPase Era [Rhodospirillaceae bacterium]|nr:GTPase Era [Rhodospirillaceae bacterium]